MKTFPLLLISLCLPCWLIAQVSLDRQVISTTGNYSVSSSGESLSATVGEAVVKTAISGSIVLTQGFQQPDGSNTVGIEDEMKLHLAWTISPNPTPDLITIQLESDLPITIGLTLFDARGRRVAVPEQEVRVSGTEETQMDLQALADGMYTLILKDEAGQIFQSFKIKKVH